jgi:DNA-binding transcriptional LysR family regulator
VGPASPRCALSSRWRSRQASPKLPCSSASRVRRSAKPCAGSRKSWACAFSTDIVRNRFDAGIRPGHRLEQDMVALRVGEDARPTVVASLNYLERHPRPVEPPDLQLHNCIRQRFASGALAPWVFEKGNGTLEVAVTGSLIVSDGDLALRAALDGVGIARLPISSVERHVADGTLVPLLETWKPKSVDFYLYYSSRRQTPAALRALIDFLKDSAGP